MTCIFVLNTLLVDYLEEVPKDLSTSMFSFRFLMIHDSKGGGENQVSELTGRKDVGGPTLKIIEGDIKTWGDNSTLVDAANQLHNNLSTPLIINNLIFSDVTMFHHDSKESNDDLRGRSDEHLPLANSLCIQYSIQGVVQHTHTNHFYTTTKISLLTTPSHSTTNKFQ